MNKRLKLIIVLFAVLLGVTQVQAQIELNIEDLLTEEVEVENPVYMPVISMGAGVIHFYGDVQNSYKNPLSGTPGFKFNLATFIDKKHYFRGNFFLMFGNVSGNQSSGEYLNFKTDVINFGINAEYNFGNFFNPSAPKRLRPFLSVGLEWLPSYNPKADLFNTNGEKYYYWSDGLIHSSPESSSNLDDKILSRDYQYETDLREQSIEKYGTNSLAVPLEVGVDWNISDRVFMRLATSYHYTFTDYLDNKPGGSGFLKNDGYTFTYAALHVDLFSDPKTIMVQKLFADLDNADYAFYMDEDNDGVWDGWDNCAGTPEGVAVDSVGCPFDGDIDGVPDYMDKEVSAHGAIVDENGVEISDDAILGLLSVRPLTRPEVEMYMQNVRQRNRSKKTAVDIPAKFKKLDTDSDNYISFDEVLKAIDDFFDQSSDLNSSDIYELNNFFFEQ